MIVETSSTKVAFNFFTVCMATFLAYLGIGAEAYAIYAVLLVIDLLTGWIKAGRMGRARTSVRMKYGILTKMMLLMMPIVLALGAKAVGVEFGDVLTVCISILVLSETYSIVSNIYTIKIGEELPEYDAVAIVGKKLRGVLMRIGEDRA